MRLSWGAGIVILTLAGLSGCAGVQQRGRSTSPMQGLSVDEPGRPGWPASGFFRWRRAAAEPRVETTRRAAPETDIWPDRSRSVLSRLIPSARSTRPAPDAGSPSLSRRESSASGSLTLTVAEANEAIARAAQPRTRDASVLTTRGESEVDDQPKSEPVDSPPLLTASIPLPDLGAKDKGDSSPEASASASAASDPDAVLAQAPPPPPLRPTPRPAPRPIEPEPEPEPVDAVPQVEPIAPKLEPQPQPEPRPEPVEVSPPITPVAPKPEVKPAEPVAPVETPEARPIEDEAPAPLAPVATTPTYREAIAPFATGQAPVAATPQVYFDSPAAAAPTRVEARPRWVFWPWKRSRSAGDGFPVETSAQLPPVQFPGSYESVAARPLVPCPDHARVVTPTAQQQIILPSAQSVVAAPVGKMRHLKALGVCIREKLDRLHDWKEEHICKHIQNFKAALKGGKCLSCGGHAKPIVRPLASPQSSPVLATSQFGLY